MTIKFSLDEVPKATRRLTIDSCIISSHHAEKNGDWSSQALLGLFVRLWQDYHIAKFYSHQIKRDVARFDVLMNSYEPAVIARCIKAMFQSPDCDWIVDKNLDFFSPDKIQRFLLGPATKMMNDESRKPEWTQPHNPTNVGVVIDPFRSSAK